MRNVYFPAILLFLTLGSCGHHSESDKLEHSIDAHSHEPSEVIVTDTLPKQTFAATEFVPEYIQLANNIEIVPNVSDAVEQVGVLTHEGSFGPLLFAEKLRAFFIELKPGMFLSEHPHPTESIVYTIRGKWVLCSEKKRQVMEEGSVFHFGSNMPTGWEAPFEGGALLLVVKTKEEGETFEPYVRGLREMGLGLEEERKAGTHFYFNELPTDHPAIQFARQVNPNFDKVLNSIND